MRCTPFAFASFVLVAAASTAAFGQWSADPMVNTAIDTDALDQDLCKVAPTADGGCWIAWFSSVPMPLNYEVRLQRLNADGVAQLGPRGILVSNNPSQTSTAGDWDLRTDSAGNAILCFNDIRGGTDREISAYRIAPNGTMLWGANGVQITDNTVDEFDSRICQTSDGMFTLVYSRGTSERGLFMQRLDGAGNIQLAAGGVRIAGFGVGGAGANDSPGFTQMVPSDNASVIVFYSRDTTSFSSPRHPTIQKYDATGAGVWNGGNAIVLQASPVPIAYYVNLASDGANGALVSWHDSRTGQLGAWVQRLDAAGNQLFPAGGVAASIQNTGPTRLHVSPTVPVLGPDNEVYVFWSERDGGQGTRAMYGQKIASDGLRQWGDGGIELTPFDTEVEDFMRAMPLPGGEAGAICVFISTPLASTQNTVLAVRVDGSGALGWGGSPVTVSNAPSSKGRFPTTRLADGGVCSVWSDSRNGTRDIYAQRLNLDGTLGAPPSNCPADFNGADGVSVQDIFDFLSDWSSQVSGGPVVLASADFNGMDGVTVQDIFDFLASWSAGCD
jgi:hypothetical protein